MNWQEAVVEAWRYQERLGAKPTARKAMEMARLIGAKFRSVDAQNLLAKFSDASRVHPEKSRDAQNEHTGCTNKEGRMHPGCTFAGANKVSLVTKPISPPLSNDSVPPAETAKREKPTIPDAEFEPDDERRVGVLLALVAAENKTGQVTAARIKALRAEMRSKLDAVGGPCWRHGCDVAIAGGKPWVYAVGVMRGNPNGPPAPVSRGSPQRERFVPKSLQPTPEKLALYAQIGKRHAIRPGADSLDRLEDLPDTGAPGTREAGPRSYADAAERV